MSDAKLHLLLHLIIALKDCLMQNYTYFSPDYSIATKLSYYGTKTRAEFKASCLNQDKVMYKYNHGTIANIYII